MARAESASPLEAAARAAEPNTIEAFRLLGNETRLAILLALWDHHEPGENKAAMSFSELYDEIEYDNSGNFSYHLEQLEGQFIRQRPDDGGYELRKTGLKVVRSVIAGAGLQDAHLEPTVIDRTCHLCEAPTAVSYEDGVLYQVCTECDGITTREHLPDGFLNACEIDPAGLRYRSADELIGAAEIVAYRHMRTMYEGICSACSGPVNARLEICENHDSEGVCSNCDRVPAYTAHFQCRVCKDYHGTTPAVVSVFHPAVIAFYYDHGIAPRWHADEYDGLTLVGVHDPEHEMSSVSKDPPEVEVEITLDGDELRLRFDETLSVVEVDW